MSTTPTLDRQRTDQLRTFLTVEAAADAARTAPSASAPRRVRRTLVAGSLGVALVAGGVALAATGAPDDPAPDAAPTTPTTGTTGTTGDVALPDDLQTIALETDGEWTTVRVVDFDAEPAAVVADLDAAGFAAEEVQAVPGPQGEPTFGTGDDPLLAVADVPAGGHGIYGIAVRLPAGAMLGVEAGDAERTYVVDGEPAVRFPGDGSMAVRVVPDVTVLVYAV